MEEFDRVAGRILEEDLGASGSVDHVVAERRARIAEPGDLRLEVIHLEHETVPPTGGGFAAVRHRPCGGAKPSRRRLRESAEASPP